MRGGVRGNPAKFFQVFGTDSPYRNDYPYQNAPNCPLNQGGPNQPPCPPLSFDPYGFWFRECTSYVAWKMNEDGQTQNPSQPSFFNAMGGGLWGKGSNWTRNATNLGYAVDANEPVEKGDIAQWVSLDHVAYVERNNGDGSVDGSEYNFAGDELGIANTVKGTDGTSSARKFQFGIRTTVPEHIIQFRRMSLSSTTAAFGPIPVRSSTDFPIAITNMSGDRTLTIAKISIK